jgi:2-phosphosulfolactate phosphatase
MQKTVVIDCFPGCVARYRRGYTVVAIDVVRATTTAATAVASGRRCFPVTSVESARRLACRIKGALLAGEQGGAMPPGFDLNNSPTELLGRGDIARPLILLSSSGTKLLHEASACEATIVACLRNYNRVADDLARNVARVALIGAGTRGEFREEDQLCCAWIAERLVARGYSPENGNTMDMISRWSGAAVDSWIHNKSAAYLRASGQQADLEFVLSHVGDLDATLRLRSGEVLIDETALELRAGNHAH